LILAFGLVYISWGTTYLAIKEGVRALPPFLFGGTRIALAGAIILGYVLVRGKWGRLTRRDWFGAALGGLTLFIGGNGLISVAQQTVDSGVASVLVSTTPLWIALLECLWPDGDRLSLPGWLGIFAGLAGVLLLLVPRLQHPATFFQDVGPLLILGSAFSWALGSLVLRYRKSAASHLTFAGLQMLLGGAGLILLGAVLGEPRHLSADRFTPAAIYSFFHLLIIGSLVGFLAYTWLLQHVPASLAGTYAYVNPLVAILVGWLLGGEEITLWIAGGMAVILTGVFLVRSGGSRTRPSRDADRKDDDRQPEPMARRERSSPIPNGPVGIARPASIYIERPDEVS
jgi:drug/metabolite transporter (DMT)-like permease